MNNLNSIARALLFLILGLLIGSYWYLMVDDIKLHSQLDNLSDGIDQNIVDVSTVTDQLATAQNNILLTKKRVDKLNSMLYNANDKIEHLQCRIECQQSQIAILRKEFK